MSKIGLNDLSAIYVGSAEVGRAYLGNSVVYEKASSTPDYLVIKAIEPSTIGLSKQASNHVIEYSYDGVSWATYYSAGTEISLASNEQVCFRGMQNANNTDSDYTQFAISGNVAISGKIQAFVLSNNPDYVDWNRSYSYYKLFAGCAALTDASKLVFEPSSRVSDFGSDGLNKCESMFEGCVNLVHSPKNIFYKTIRPNMLSHMFEGCTSLVDAPTLHAVRFSGTGNINGMYRMFAGCTSLVSVPSYTIVSDIAAYGNRGMVEMFRGCSSLEYIPWTILGGRNEWYQNMFKDCVSLKESPLLLFTDGGPYNGFVGAFSGCESLSKITCLGNNQGSAQQNWRDWVVGVAASGTFYKHPDAVWSTGTSGIPTGWTVQDYTEP